MICTDVSYYELPFGKFYCRFFYLILSESIEFYEDETFSQSWPPHYKLSKEHTV